MYNRMQFAVIMIAAMLSAWILSGSCHPVLADPIVRSTDGTPVAPTEAVPLATQARARVYLFRGALGPPSAFNKAASRLTSTSSRLPVNCRPSHP